MKTGIIIQARASSSRLPGKVLLPLPWPNGPSVLAHVVGRMQQSQLAQQVIVATSTQTEDDAVAQEAESAGAQVYRGSLSDVLGRFAGAAQAFGLDCIVRITADCPLHHAIVVDQLLAHRQRTGADYDQNCRPRTYAHGLDAEVFTRAALETAAARATAAYDREHVTPYFYRTAPQDFQLAHCEAPAEWQAPDYRLTLDERADYTLVAAIYDHLYAGHPHFSPLEVYRLLREKPYLTWINDTVGQKRLFASWDEEKAAAQRLLMQHDMPQAAARLE